MMENNMEQNSMDQNNMDQNNMEQNNMDQHIPDQETHDSESRHLSEHFFHIGMLLHRYQTETAREHGPMGSPFKGQGRILAILKLKPEISHRELSYLLGISTQSMSELLRKLEAKGYVKRVPSEQDRRSMNILLTEEGKKAVDQAGGVEDHDPERLFDCFGEEEKELFKQYLERLEQAIIGRLDPDHAEEYTFEKMKEMHDYILTRGPEEHEGPHSRHPHHHPHHPQPGVPGRRPEGPLPGGFGRRPEGPLPGGFGHGPEGDDAFRRRLGRRRQMWEE